MSGSSESADLQLLCELELANKDIFQLESLIKSRGIKYESDDAGGEKHCAIHACHQLGHAQIIAEGPQLFFYALFNASLGAAARISRCALDEPGGHTGFVQIFVP